MTVKTIGRRLARREPTTDERVAAALKALANESRLQIYRELLQRRSSEPAPHDEFSCVLVEFINSLPVGAPTVSHHVKALAKAGLIRVERNGRFLSLALDEDMRLLLRDFFGGR